MVKLENYFTHKNLISELAKHRALLAKKRHDLNFLRNISYTQKDEEEKETYLPDIYPPRRQWIRLELKERKGKNPFEINRISIGRTMLRAIKKDFKSRWVVTLNSYIMYIQTKVFNGTFQVGKPEIKAIEKDKDNKICRPIAIYSLVDRVVISQIAKYLIDVFDEDFLDCSYAFRSSRKRNICPTHHDAVEDIIKYKKKKNKDHLWVAECDIKKFYDTVCHEIAKYCLYKAVGRAQNRGKKVDERAIDLFLSYLNSYSFNVDVYNKDASWFADQGKAGWRFDWLNTEEIVNTYKLWEHERIGVPQGGALSCLIANLVLDEADRMVAGYTNSDNDLHYARYCDDIVILHSNEDTCKNVIDKYVDTLKALKLNIHEPEHIEVYNKRFWKQKSKNPYKWTNNNHDVKNVPWLSFVGYHIRYDGMLRVRPKSVKKQIEKQVNECDKVIRFIKKRLKHRQNKIKVSHQQILFRLQQRLLSMSVGKNDFKSVSRYPQYCWAAGFKLLHNYPHNKTQLRKLDRNRERQLKRLKRFLKGKKLKVDKSKPKSGVKPLQYYGYPFSYFGQFGKLNKP